RLVLPGAFLFVLAGVLRLIPLNHQGLWADELFSLAFATGHSLEHAASRAQPELGDYGGATQPLTMAKYQRYLQPQTPASPPPPAAAGLSGPPLARTPPHGSIPCCYGAGRRPPERRMWRCVSSRCCGPCRPFRWCGRWPGSLEEGPLSSPPACSTRSRLY